MVSQFWLHIIVIEEFLTNINAWIPPQRFCWYWSRGHIGYWDYFCQCFPDDSNVESRLKLTGPSGVIREAGHHIRKEDVPIWKRWGMLFWKKISRINQLSLIRYSHAMQYRQYRKRLLFKKDFLLMYVTWEAHWLSGEETSVGACVLFLFFYWF